MAAWVGFTPTIFSVFMEFDCRLAYACCVGRNV